MTTGYARTDSGNIVDGNTVRASYFNNEYNAILAAFDASTGHNHGGGSGQGSPIALTTGVTGVLDIANGGTNTSSLSAYGLIGVNSAATTLTSTVLTDGQILIGRTGAVPLAAVIASGTGMTVTSTAGTITIGINAEYAGQSSITTVGTISSGTWNGSTIAASYLVGSDIATVGTITSGTWNGSLIVGQFGGTGVANTGKTITLGGNLITSGAFACTLTLTGTTNVTLPTSGTLVNNAVTTLSSLTSVGTIGTGVWQGTVIASAYGGAGTINGILKSNGSGTTSLASSTTDYVAQATTSTLSVGYATTPFSAGTKSSGTFTPSEASGAFQYATNGGAHTLAPPSNNTNLVIEYTNNGSAGTITTSGFTKVDGSFDTTNAHKFLAYITKHQNSSYLNIVALQ